MAETPIRRTKQGSHRPVTPAPKVVWDDRVEHLYQSWHRRVAAAETGHRLMSDRLRRRHLIFGIPVVVLTTIVGTSVFASLQDAKVSTSIRAIVGAVSLVAAVLSSLQTFLRYATRAEGHRIGAIRYETLRRDMAKVLALPRKARGDPVRELDSVRQRMDRYAKESPTIGERQWEKLAPEFHLSKVPPDPAWTGDPIRIPEPEVAAPATDEGQAKGDSDGR